MPADLQATRVFQETAGEWVPVIFVHGLGGTETCSTPCAWGWRSTARSSRLDLPGSGRLEKK